MSLTLLIHLGLCIIANREWSLQNTKSKFMVCPDDLCEGFHSEIKDFSDFPDPMSESLLATAAAPSATSKFKTVELCNPTSIVELKYTGTLSFRWAFKWEE